MKAFIFILTLSIISFVVKAQTVIEMMSPADADIILMEVNDITKADILVYKTRKTSEAREWNLKWKFKHGGWANYSIYVAKDFDELTVNPEDEFDDVTITYKPNGYVYFVTSPDSTKHVNCVEGILIVGKKTTK